MGRVARLAPMQYYRKRMTRFCSEFGFESLPDAKAIRQYAKPGDYALNSPVFNLHQKCASGNDKMVYYIASRFHLPRRFWDYIYLSQVTQDTCIADATEHWRRHKGQCNGAMYWQFNDCWGVCSWSSLDYYGNYKALQYGARRFNAPLSVSVEDSKERFDVYVLNDLNARQTVTVEYELFDFVTGTLEKEKKKLLLPPVENAVAFSREMAPLRKKYDLRRTGLAVPAGAKRRLPATKDGAFRPGKALAAARRQVAHQGGDPKRPTVPDGDHRPVCPAGAFGEQPHFVTL